MKILSAAALIVLGFSLAVSASARDHSPGARNPRGNHRISKEERRSAMKERRRSHEAKRQENKERSRAKKNNKLKAI